MKKPRGRARKLLAEAGYPNGFDVTLDCTNDRDILDEQICVALAGMFSKVGIDATPNPKAIFFQKTNSSKRETSLMLIGHYSTTVDAGALLEGVLHTYNGKGAADNNTGQYSNSRMDALIKAARVELDTTKRLALPEEIQLLQNEDIATIPIHQQLPSWAMRRNIDMLARLDNGLDLRWVVVR